MGCIAWLDATRSPSMHLNETRLVQRLRSPELSHSLRGFDEAETRRLLEEAATALAEVYAARDQARNEAYVAAQAKDAADAEAIGRALLTATATGEQIVASAKEQAEHVVAEATTEAEGIRAEAREVRDELEREREGERRRIDGDRHELLAAARIEADRLRAAARVDVARIRQEVNEVAALLESSRAAFAERAAEALERLHRVETEVATELVADLHPGAD